MRSSSKLYSFLFLLGLTSVVSSLDFASSSSEDCDDDGRGGGGGGRPGGGGGRPRPPGGGGGGNNANRGCPNGWTRFERPSGPWCLRVYPGNNFDMSVASAACVTNGGVLSGVQSPQETSWIADSATRTLGGGSGSIWVGARRLGRCMNSKLTATCGQLNSFYWTDTSTSGTDGFSWLAKNQPDNAHGLVQNCVVMFYAADTVSYKGTNWWPGALDDTACSTAQFATDGARVMKGFVCGRRAASR